MNRATFARPRTWGALALLLAIPLFITAIATSVVGGASERIDRVPALIVNNDELVMVTGADGTQQPIIAGRLLVTALTGSDSPGFDWQLSSDKEAAAALKSGAAYAVVTIPENFSKSIASLSSSDPVQADITLTTDEANSYLAGSLAQSLGMAMTATLGQGITEQYLSGLFGTLSSFSGQIGDAAGGASELANGSAQLADGLLTLSGGTAAAATGASEAATGAQRYSAGVNQYTAGVDQLAGGLAGLATNTSQLGELGGALQEYIAGVTAFAQTADCANPAVCGYFVAFGSNPDIQQGVAGLAPLEAGISQLSAGANQLAAGSQGVRDGAAGIANGVTELSTGLGELAGGMQASAEAAGQLSVGAKALADGLNSGSEQLGGALADPDQAAKVVSQPVTLTDERNNPIESLNDLVALLIVPMALWLGTLAIFLARRPFRSVELQSTVGSAAVVRRSVIRALGYSIVQLVLALIVAAIVGVTPGALLLAAPFALVVAFGFVALHLLIWLVWPRAASLVSILLVVLQIVLLPGVLPVEALPSALATVSQLLPMTWAVNGMQAIAAGTNYGTVVAAAAGLIALGVLALAVTTATLSRRRVSRAWGFAVARSV